MFPKIGVPQNGWLFIMENPIKINDLGGPPLFLKTPILIIYIPGTPKQPFINGCFNWMIPNLYIGNGCFTKQPFINGCLGFQVYIYMFYMVIKRI